MRIIIRVSLYLHIVCEVKHVVPIKKISTNINIDLVVHVLCNGENNNIYIILIYLSVLFLDLNKHIYKYKWLFMK